MPDAFLGSRFADSAEGESRENPAAHAPFGA
jgi:hypothetical protein